MQLRMLQILIKLIVNLIVSDEDPGSRAESHSRHGIRGLAMVWSSTPWILPFITAVPQETLRTDSSTTRFGL